MSTTNELFNSFCLALREDLKHRKRQTAAINGIVADIEAQADEAVARIQAMATTEYRCCRCDTWCLWQTEASLHAQEKMCAKCFDDNTEEQS